MAKAKALRILSQANLQPQEFTAARGLGQISGLPSSQRSLAGGRTTKQCEWFRPT
jgi:hypothetical protein